MYRGYPRRNRGNATTACVEVRCQASSARCARGASASSSSHTSGQACVNGISPRPPWACSLNTRAAIPARSSSCATRCASGRSAATYNRCINFRYEGPKPACLSPSTPYPRILCVEAETNFDLDLPVGDFAVLEMAARSITSNQSRLCRFLPARAMALRHGLVRTLWGRPDNFNHFVSVFAHDFPPRGCEVRVSKGRQTRLQAVENVLRRQRREHYAEHAADDVGAGLANQAQQPAGKQQRPQRHRQHQHHDHERGADNGRIVALLADHEQHRGERAGTGNQRDRQREHRNILAVLGLALLALGGRAQPGVAREQHVHREQEQQHATRDLKRRHTDAERAQQRVADDDKGDENASGDEHAAQRQPAPLPGGVIVRQRGEHRREADGIDHDEQDDEAIEEQFDHARPGRRSMRLTLPVRMGDAKAKNCRRPKDGPPGRGGGRCGERPGGGVPQAGQCDRQRRGFTPRPH